MLDNKYVILSVPRTGKSVVLKVADKSDELTLNIAGLNMNASLITINNSFEEAKIVVDNLTKI